MTEAFERRPKMSVAVVIVAAGRGERAGQGDGPKQYRKIGGKAVMKIVSPDILHKTDAGGVALNIESAGAAREAFERLYFEHHLKGEGGNMTRIADRTGLERTHLYRKLKQLGLSAGKRSEEQEA